MMDRVFDHGVFDRRDLQTLRVAYDMGCGFLGEAGISCSEAKSDLATLIFQNGREAKMAGHGLKDQAIAALIAAQAHAALMTRHALPLCA